MLNLSGYGHGKLRCVPVVGGKLTWSFEGASANDLYDLPGSFLAKRESFNVIKAEYLKRGIEITFDSWKEVSNNEADEA